MAELDVYAILYTTIISLTASTVNGAIGTGGVFLLVSLLITLFPVTTAIPLLPLFAAGSLIGRVVAFRQYIEWHITRQFMLGAMVGTTLGILTFNVLSGALLSRFLGVFILVMTWWPIKHIATTPAYGYVTIGVLHTFVSTIIGAGSILQMFIIRTGLSRKAIVGSVAMCTIFMEFFKVSGYILSGFDYRQYWLLFIVATLTGILGTWFGKIIGEHIPEQLFRKLVNYIISVMAIRIIIMSF